MFQKTLSFVEIMLKILSFDNFILLLFIFFYFLGFTYFVILDTDFKLSTSHTRELEYLLPLA
jgi:hypothetical protein